MIVRGHYINPLIMFRPISQYKQESDFFFAFGIKILFFFLFVFFVRFINFHFNPRKTSRLNFWPQCPQLEHSGFAQ